MVTHACNVVDSEANNHFSNALMSVHYIILSKREREEWRKRERGVEEERERERSGWGKIVIVSYCFNIGH